MAKAKRAPVKRGAQQGRGKGAQPEGTAGAPLPKAQGATKAGAAAGQAAGDLAAASAVPPAGLQNLGNTCFFNSAIQVLAAAPAVQQCYGGSDQPARRAPLGSAMHEVMQATSGVEEDAPAAPVPAPANKRGGGGAAKRAGAAMYSPHRLLAAVRRIAPQFKGGGQQDSHELLRCLLAGLQTEECSLLKAEERSAAQPSSTADTAQQAAAQVEGSTVAAAQGHADSDAEVTTVESLFGGKLASTVVCGSCGHTSTQLEKFMDLSLPVASVAVAKQPAGAEPPAGGAGAAAAKPPRPLNPKQRKAAAKQASSCRAPLRALRSHQERKLAKLARSRAARAASAELPGEAGAAVKGRRGRRVPLTPAASVRHSPPGRGALPPRPAIRSSSMSSLASSEASAATGQPPGSALGSRPSADSRGGGGGLGVHSGGGATSPLQQHPMRLTMELMHSISPPVAGADDEGEDDPFLRAMSRTSTPPASVLSDLESTMAARHSSGPPSLDGDTSNDEEALSPTRARHRASSGGASPVTVPAGASRLSRQSAAQPSREPPAASPGDGAAAELRLRGVEEPKLRGGAEPGTADIATRDESEAAAAAATQAAGRAAAEAEAAAGAIAAEAGAEAGVQPPGGKGAAAQPSTARRRGEAAMQRQHSFLDDSIQVAGAAATAQAAGDAAASAGGGSSADAAAGADVVPGQQPDAAEPATGLQPATSAFAAAAQQPAEAQPAAAAEAASDSGSGDMGALGSLFDDSAAPATTASAPLAQDWGTDDHAVSGTDSAETTLQDCLAAFFAPEAITYTCPREAAAAKAAAAEAADADRSAASPTALSNPRLLGLSAAPSGESGGSEASAARKVSWSDSPHVVVMIPGSEEQRGTDLRAALKGHEPFSRPLSHNGASLIVTAHMDQFRNDTLTLQIHPHDMELSTVSQLDRTMDLTTVHIDRIQEFDSREEQARVQEAAQILMDCVADIVDCHGLGPLRSMCNAMQLQRSPSAGTYLNMDPAADGGGTQQQPQQQPRQQPQQALPVQYCVTGVMPDGMSKDGWKTWTYPSAQHPRPSGSVGAVPGRRASLDTVSSGSLDFMLSSTSSGGSGNAPAAAALGEMPLPAALEHAASLSRRLASGSRDGGGGSGSDSSCGAAVIVVDERLYASAPELAQLAATADAATQDSASSAAAPAQLADTGAAGEVVAADDAAAAAAAVGQQAADDMAAAVVTMPAGEGGRPPTGARSATQDEAAAAVAPGPAVKSYAIQQPPQLLTLHLKRFEQNKRGQFLKVSRRVRFSFRLDVTPFLSHPAAGGAPAVAATAAGGSAGGRQPAAQAPEERAAGACAPGAGGGAGQQRLGAACYQLVGLVEHSGTMRSGHYVAYVQRRGAAASPPEPQLQPAANGLPPPPSVAAGAEPQPAAPAGPGDHAAGTPPDAPGTRTGSPQQPDGARDGPAGAAAAQPEQLAWFRVSDQHVKRVTWPQVLAAEAYLLLYARV